MIKTNNGRIVLSQGFQEYKQMPISRTERREIESKPQKVGFIETVDIDHSVIRQLNQLVTIKLAKIMRMPMRQVIILDGYNLDVRAESVFLVKFLPHMEYDPIMPITIRDLGVHHDDSFRNFAYWLMDWHPRKMSISQSKWYNSAYVYAYNCCEWAFHHLCRDSAEWFSQEMMYTLSNPDRRDLSGGRGITIGRIER